MCFKQPMYILLYEMYMYYHPTLVWLNMLRVGLNMLLSRLNLLSVWVALAKLAITLWFSSLIIITYAWFTVGKWLIKRMWLLTYEYDSFRPMKNWYNFCHCRYITYTLDPSQLQLDVRIINPNSSFNLE